MTRSAQNLQECEEYVLKEVPGRLRQLLGRELDRDLTIVEEGLRRKAADCVKTLLVVTKPEGRPGRHVDQPECFAGVVIVTVMNGMESTALNELQMTTRIVIGCPR